MRAQNQVRSAFHWDKRGKKYVKLQAGESVKLGKRVKTESGAKVRLAGCTLCLVQAASCCCCCCCC
jgi:hypothetical protein